MLRSILKVVMIGIVIFTSSILSAAPQAQKFIIKDGEALGKIQPPAYCNKAILFAIQELQLHLKEMTSANVKLSWNNKTKRFSGFIFKIRPKNEWKGKESAQAFTIEQSATPLPLVTISGNTGIAVLYGVYQYLGDLGVRWLTPGDIGTNIPRMSSIPIQPGKRKYSPSFNARVLTLSSTPSNHFGGVDDLKKALYDYRIYLIRNRTQFGYNRFAAKDFSFNVSHAPTGAHAIKPMVGLTNEKVKAGLMEKAPERFALVTGNDFVQKRNYHGGQVCFTNETNIKTAIKNCVAHFKKLKKTKGSRCSDFDEDNMISMGLSDTWGICECENCAKVAGKEPYSSDRLVWSFWNRVAKALNKEMPGCQMTMHSPYMMLHQPPKDVKIEPNIVVLTPNVYSWEKTLTTKESFPFSKNFFEDVKRTRDSGALNFTNYNYLAFPWSPTPLQILDIAEGYAKRNDKYYHLEGMQRTEYSWPIIWTLAQYLWDTKKSTRDYLKEFCIDYYGERYGKDILWIFEEMTKNSKNMERILFGSPADNSYMFPDKFIGKARGSLRNAIRKSQGKERERLRRFSISIDSQFRMAQVYRAYTKAVEERTDEAITDFQKQAKELINFWDKKRIKKYNSTSRTPKIAANIYLKTDFKAIKPIARKALKGKGPKDIIWMKELFASMFGKSIVPKSVPNLFPLPEIWKFHLDIYGKGVEEGWIKPNYDDSKKGWNNVSTWAMVESQGYKKVGGYFCYRLNFKAPKFPEGKKVFLRIGALDDSGEVYLNGVKVGESLDPRDWDKSFVMDVTKELKQGEENVIAVYGYDSGGGMGLWRPCALYTD